MSAVSAVGKYAYVPWHKQFFVDQGRYHYKEDYTPVPGDIVVFKNESHIGIVAEVCNGFVTTVEGNTSGGSTLVKNGGGVWKKSYSLTSQYLEGYGNPAYSYGEAAKMVQAALSEVGYTEKASNSGLDSNTANPGTANYTKYGAWYGLNPAEWCDMFVSYCAHVVDDGASVPEKTLILYNPVKQYRNGSTDETCYADTGMTVKTGSLNPWESCDCLGKIGDLYIVCYPVDGTNEYKVGLVEYDGGL